MSRSRSSSSSDYSDIAEKRRYHEHRLKAVFANERKTQEIEALEKMVDEMKKLIERTQRYIGDSKERLAIRESMLKLTLPIRDIQFAESVLSRLPILPQRYHPRPKVLDDALISFMLLGGYVKPDFSEEEEQDLRQLPDVIDVESQLYEELAAAPDLVIEVPDYPDSPDPEPQPERIGNPIVRESHEVERSHWVDEIIKEMDE